MPCGGFNITCQGTNSSFASTVLKKPHQILKRIVAWWQWGLYHSTLDVEECDICHFCFPALLLLFQPGKIETTHVFVATATLWPILVWRHYHFKWLWPRPYALRSNAGVPCVDKVKGRFLNCNDEVHWRVLVPATSVFYFMWMLHPVRCHLAKTGSAYLGLECRNRVVHNSY